MELGLLFDRQFQYDILKIVLGFELLQLKKFKKNVIPNLIGNDGIFYFHFLSLSLIQSSLKPHHTNQLKGYFHVYPL